MSLKQQQTTVEKIMIQLRSSQAPDSVSISNTTCNAQVQYRAAVATDKIEANDNARCNWIDNSSVQFVSVAETTNDDE